MHAITIGRMEEPSALSTLTQQFPAGWREQWRFLDGAGNCVLHVASAMACSVSIGPAVEPPERRRAVVSVIQEARVPLCPDLANFMAAQAVKLVLES